MKRKVNTVCGPVDSDQLGGVLAHEHFIFGYPGWYGDTVQSARFDREATLKRWMEVCKKVKALGIHTIVDATPNECGRDVLLLREISERAEIHVICSTGFYFSGGGAPSYFNFRSMGHDVEKEIEELLYEELYHGIGDTGIKAGVIKLSSGANEIDPYEQRFFRAAARIASRDKDIRMITHTQNGTCGPEQAQLLISGGVDPRQIAIGHIEGSTDIDYLLRVAEQGVYMNFDRFGLDTAYGCPSDQRRIACVAVLTAMGYGDKICLSHDCNLDFWGRPFKFPEELEKLLVNSNWYHICEHIIPAMQKAGMSPEQTHKFLYENPQNFYGAF